MQSVKVGDIYDIAKVVRVDKGMGLLLEIPSTPLPTPAFVNVCSLCIYSHIQCPFLS
jgi:rRNA biogenesis protein RRP5